MKYKHPPIFKYIFLLICIFMFIKHLKIMVNHQNLMISLSILSMITVLDFILIDNHPNLLGNDEVEDFIASHISEDIITNDDIDDILNDIDINNIQDDLNSDEQQEYPNTHALYQLPTDYKQQSFDLNEDCYRRGDGRGNNKKVQKYYERDVL
jgi:hypothetical protein